MRWHQRLEPGEVILPGGLLPRGGGGVGALIKGLDRSWALLPFHLCHVRVQQEDPPPTPDAGVLTFQHWEKWSPVLYQLPSLWYFVAVVPDRLRHKHHSPIQSSKGLEESGLKISHSHLCRLVPCPQFPHIGTRYVPKSTDFSDDKLVYIFSCKSVSFQSVS